jgi:hemoglobin
MPESVANLYIEDKELIDIATCKAKTDIRDRKDIDRLMDAFYSKALTDPVIGYIFTDVAKLDLEHHLPIIGDFWESLLFQTGDYARHGRNPLRVHADLDNKSPLLTEHFARWLDIFYETVDELFDGTRSSYIKVRAEAIAGNMLRFLGQSPVTPV